jgi:hypothetical protein
MATRARLYVLLPVLFFSIYGISQSKDSLPPQQKRYRLDLPKEWKRPKLIQAITDILPETIDELKDLEFCTSGKAAYNIRLAIDSIVISNEQTSLPVEIGSIPHYTFSFSYNFHAAMVVFDSLGKPVSMLQLISNEETMTYSKQFSLTPQNVVLKYETIYDLRGRAVGRRLVEEARAVNNFVPKINAGSVITGDFLLNICERKIYEIRRLLKKINPD